MLIVLLVLPEMAEAHRRRHHHGKKHGEKAAARASKKASKTASKKAKASGAPHPTPNVCVQAVGTPSLVDNPDPKKAKVLGKAHAGEAFHQTHSVGSDYIIVKNARGGGYSKKAEWKPVACSASASAPASTTPTGASAPLGPRVPAVSGVPASGVQPGGIQPASDARSTHVCVTPTTKAELRSKADSTGAVIGFASAGEEWEQTEIMASGWVKVENQKLGLAFTQPNGWIQCQHLKSANQKEVTPVASGETPVASGDFKEAEAKYEETGIEERAVNEAQGVGLPDGWPHGDAASSDAASSVSSASASPPTAPLGASGAHAPVAASTASTTHQKKEKGHKGKGHKSHESHKGHKSHKSHKSHRGHQNGHKNHKSRRTHKKKPSGG